MNDETTRMRCDYAPSRLPDDIGRSRTPGGLVARVEPDSPAVQAGIVAGMVITYVDGYKLKDAIDWSWASNDLEIELEVEVDEKLSRQLGEESAFVFQTVLTRSPHESWGIEFCDPLFGDVMRCRNSCVFCFMKMLPKGMRDSLYVRDDDYRLSFLQGNFVTLTNLAEEDLCRIIDMNLSPLHVSLHATSPAVRKELIGRHAEDGMACLERLLDADIGVHTQIVLVPGINDGAELMRTLSWVSDRDAILSCGIVPLGYTSHQTRFDRSYDDAVSAREILEIVRPFQEKCRIECGKTRIHLADEFYLNAGVSMPPAAHYDGFEQFEDGIGMVRSFIDEWKEAKSDAVLAKPCSQAQASRKKMVACLTGEAFAPVLDSLIRDSPLARNVRVVAVKNSFFGGNVSVAGLLCARDILRVLNDDERLKDVDTVFIPDVMFNASGVTLDDYTVSDLQRASARHLEVVSCEANESYRCLSDAVQ